MSAFALLAPKFAFAPTRTEKSVPTDSFGTVLNVGDVVVEPRMSRSGITCPKMSDKPEMYEIVRLSGGSPEMIRLYGIDGYVTVRALQTGISKTFHSSEIVWVA